MRATTPLVMSLLVGALACVSCTSRLDVPADAALACRSSADCPKGWLCASGLERCVLPENLDKTPPSLVGEPRLAPSVLARDMQAAVTFEVSESLAQDPVVLLHVGDGVDRPFTKDAAASSGARYVYTYTSVGPELEPEGVDVPVIVGLVDLSGNDSGAKRVGSVRFDHTPPAVVAGSARLQLIPDERSNPLSTVRLATVGTTVVVTFSLSEALGGTAALSLGLVHSQDTLACGAPQGTTFTCSGTLENATSVGESDEVRLLGSVADAVGNTAENLLVTTCDVDAQPPPSPDTTTSERLVLRRSPWGTAASPSPRLSLVGQAGALPSEPAPTGVHHLAVYSKATTAAAMRLGLITVEENGSFAETALSGSDLPVLYVTAVDDAGNESAPVEVRDIVWTATLGQKAPGDNVANPTSLLKASPLGAALEQAQATTAEPSAAELRALWPSETSTSSGIAVSAKPNWSVMAGSLTPPGRYRQAMAYDRASGRVLIFGGTDTVGGNCRQDSWQWDTARQTWSERAATNLGPGANCNPPLVYDSYRGRLVMLSGAALWEWNDTLAWWTPSMVDETGGVPPSRTGYGLVFDDLRHKLLLFGGDDGSALRNDLWEFDFTTHRWSERPGLGDAPSPRRSMSMVFDAGLGVLLLFGGYADDGTGGALAGDTWMWSAASDAWTRLAITGPTPRFDAAIAYDGWRGKSVLFGGHAIDDLDDLWEWSWSAGGPSGSWQSVASTGTPCARVGARLVFDTAKGHLLLFGGADLPPDDIPVENFGYKFFADLYELDPATRTWREHKPTVTAATPPGNRTHLAAALDADSRSVVVAGGSGNSCGGCPPHIYDEAWRFVPETLSWSALPSLSSRRVDAAMAFDPARHTMLLLGGALGTTPVDELVELTGGSWVAPSSTGGPPPARYAAELAVDPATNTVLLFGGQANGTTALGDLWLWDGDAATWSQPTTTGTPPVGRGHFGMAVNPIAHALVLFGGRSGADCGVGGPPREILGDTWELDLDTWEWHEHHPTSGPTARLGQRMVYDEMRDTVVLVAGEAICSGPAFDEAWEWDSVLHTWSPILQGNHPSPRSDFALVRDPAARQTLVLGGSLPEAGGIEVWQSALSSTELPAVLWKVPFAAAEAPADFGLLEIAGVVVGGGAGRLSDAAAEQPGLRLYRWDTPAGSWVPLAASAAPLAEPAALGWAVSQRRALAGMLLGETLDVNLAVTPRAGSINGTVATLQARYLETTIRYHRGALLGWELNSDGDSEGWTATNLTSATGPSGGTWSMTFADASGSLEASAVGVAATPYHALQMRLQASTAMTAEMAWLHDEASTWDEATALTFSVPASVTPTTIKLPLDSSAQWTGRIARLRLVFHAAAGASLALDWLRLTD
jgi:hypothetical protein